MEQNCKCGGGGKYDVHLETCSKVNTPEKQEWEERFVTEIVPIIENPLLEYNHSEGHEQPKKCTAVDIGIIKSFISQVRQEAVEKREEELRQKFIEEVNILPFREISQHEATEIYQARRYGFNRAKEQLIKLILQLLKSKE